MKGDLIKLNVLLLVVAVFISCNSSTSSGEYVVADIRKGIKNPQKLQLADEIESVRYVPLEVTDDDQSLIGGVLATAFTDKYIFVQPAEDGRILQFDKEGKFVKTVIREGQGPGEFSGVVFGMQADQKNDRLYLFCSGRTYIYDLEGNFIRNYAPSYLTAFTYVLVNDRLAAVAFPYITFQAGSFGMAVFNEKGDTIAMKNNFTSPLVDADKAGFTLGLTPPAFSEKYSSVLLKTGSNDTLFRISPNKIEPAMILNLQNSDNEVVRSLDATDFSSLLDNKFEGDGDIFITDIFETPHNYYYRLRYYKEYYVASVNKKTGNTMVEKCLQPGNPERLADSNIQFGMIGTTSYNDFPVWGNMHGDYLIQTINPYELSMFKESESINLPEVLEDVSEDANPIFIFYKIRS